MAARLLRGARGAPRREPADEIQRAYRKLARTYHPDVNKDPGAEERFKEISEAYDVLSDPETRSALRRLRPRLPAGARGRRPADAGAGAGAGRGGRRAGRHARGRSAAPAGGGPGGPRLRRWRTSTSRTCFGGLFGGGGRRGLRRTDPRRRPGSRARAHGRGGLPRAGAVPSRLPGRTGTRTLEVTIPAGVDRRPADPPGRPGRAGHGGAPAGDLYLVVRIAPHPRYRVAGRDITVELPLTPWEAALGHDRRGRHPGRRGQGARCRPARPAAAGCGCAAGACPIHAAQPGDLYAEVRIMVPADSDRRRAAAVRGARGRPPPSTRGRRA